MILLLNTVYEKTDSINEYLKFEMEFQSILTFDYVHRFIQIFLYM